MTICYFGDYDAGYNRTHVLLTGLRAAGVTVIECNVRGKSGWALYRELWRKHRDLKGSYDLLFVGLGNARFMPLFARLISRKPVVWEPLFALYDNWVHDRKYVHPYSLKALKLWLVDFIGCHAAGLVILDVDTHARYFMSLFGLPRRKVAHAYVGADPDLFKPAAKQTSDEIFEVEFHGKYIPLHGTDVIVRAAQILSDEKIHFTLIGDGQDAQKCKDLAQELGVTNVTFLPWMSEAEIVPYIRDADLCTAMLGDVPRVVRSIPNKMYQAAAMARVSINAESSSLREVFTPGVDALAVQPGNPEALAAAILELKRSGKARAMGEAAYQTYLKTSTPAHVGQQVVEAIRTRFPGMKSNPGSI